eukprot:GDKI01031023.1.p1 GENE.GDKI01031023.1~~GDKI01031023.1.p1  ORF type:complete len:131 (-),score=46.13 GDKI01031023.1:27-419(-)
MADKARGTNLDEGQAGEESAWTVEEVEKIVVETLDATLKDQDYVEEKVPQWVNAVCEQAMKRLAELKKPFKYIVSCVIMQRTGAGIHTATSSFWDTVNDGVFTYVWPKEKSKEHVKKSMYAIVTVFGLEF